MVQIGTDADGGAGTPAPPGWSPTARSMPANTPGNRSMSARGGLNTAPGMAAGKLPHLSAWPKPEEGYTLGVRPQTSPSGGDMASFISRLNAPSSPRARGASPRLGRLSPAGRVMPSEADSQAMIVRQREAFIKMHAKCEALERTNARLSNRVAVLERETVSLRVSATISVTPWATHSMSTNTKTSCQSLPISPCI